MVLPEHLTIIEITDWKEKFVSEIQGLSAHEVDVSRLKKIDSAGIQLLFAVRQALQQKGGDICWVGTSDLLTRNSDWLGMCDALNIAR